MENSLLKMNVEIDQGKYKRVFIRFASGRPFEFFVPDFYDKDEICQMISGWMQDASDRNLAEIKRRLEEFESARNIEGDK